jgi:hypothetical protein
MRNQLRAARDRARQLRPQLSQKRQRGLAIVHIARTVLHAQNVGGLRQVRHNRVVARHLPVVRVVPSERALHSQPGRDHHAIDIHRDRVQPQAGDDVLDHGSIQRLEPFDRLHRELREPPTHRARRRQHLQPTQAQEDRIVSHIAHVVQAPAADHEQPDQQSNHGDNTEVAAQARASKSASDPIVETHRTQIAIEQLQSRVGRQLDLPELELKIAVDTGLQFGVSSSHLQWPFVRGLKVWVAPSFNHNERPFSISK